MPFVEHHCYTAECSACGLPGENGDGVVMHEPGRYLYDGLAAKGWTEIAGEPYCWDCWHYEGEDQDGEPVVCARDRRCEACKDPLEARNEQ